MLCGIYVITVPKAEPTYYKIGMSTNLTKRIKNYRGYNIWGFNVIYKLIIHSRYKLRLRSIEKRIHKIFNEQRVKPKYEWFNLDNDKLLFKLRNVLLRFKRIYGIRLDELNALHSPHKLDSITTSPSSE